LGIQNFRKSKSRHVLPHASMGRKRDRSSPEKEREKSLSLEKGVACNPRKDRKLMLKERAWSALL